MAAQTIGTFHELVDELAHEQRQAQFPKQLTHDDVAKHVDAAVIADWLGIESATRSPELVFSEVISERLSPVKAVSAMMALATGDGVRAAAMLQPALTEAVARDLAYHVNKAVNEYEPTEAELTRVEPFDDPVRADRRDIARDHNGTLRAYERVFGSVA